MSIKRILLFLAALVGFLMLLFFLLTDVAAAGGWIQEVSGGLGDNQNSIAYSSVSYKGRLYIGTYNPNGCEIWSWDGSGWAVVIGLGAPGTATAPGFGTSDNYAVESMAVFTGYLYAGVTNSTGCRVWRYDGFDWEQVVGGGAGGSATGPGFGNTDNDGVPSMELYGSHLYFGTYSTVAGCEVWRSDGVNVVPVVGATSMVPAGFGNVNNHEAYSARAFGSHLYIGALNTGGCEVWRYDGANWAPLVGGGGAIAAGFGDSANTNISSMAIFDSRLVMATSNTNGCDLWGWDGTVWSQLIGQGAPGTPTGPGFGNNANRGVASMTIYDSHLYAGTANLAVGCEVWRYDGAGWSQAVGQDPAGTPGTGPGFGNASNSYAMCMGVFDAHIYFGTYNANSCEVWSNKSATTWYLAEGATKGGYETWILVQNPNASEVGITIKFQTDTGEVAGPVDTIPANSRRSYLANAYVNSFDVSTKVVSNGPDIICERSLYWTPAGGTNSVLGHDSIGVIAPAARWYLAEGATKGGYETWVLVQNPNANPVNIDMKFQTESGQVQGPIDTIAAESRRSYPVDSWVDTFNVSTAVTCTTPGGLIICERAVYFTPAGSPHKQVGTDSIGVVEPASNWYLAEGASDGGYETWILIQNPNPNDVNVNIKYQTTDGEVQGPIETVFSGTRKSFRVNDKVKDFNVSTTVTSFGGDVICERSMYWTPPGGTQKILGHDSIGVRTGEATWYLAEGASKGGFETWVLVQNPNSVAVTVDLQFQTGAGEVAGPTDTIPAKSRRSYRVNSWVESYDVSTKVTSIGSAPIICERSVYWTPPGTSVKVLGTDSVGFNL